MQRIACLSILLATCLLSSKPASAQHRPEFKDKGRAFLEKHCLDCHSGSEPQAELSLDQFRESDSLVKQRKTWDNILQMIQTGSMPPEDATQPTLAEKEAFVAEVQAIFEYAERNAKPNPGRVTMRRLNRKEYRNTIRDLIGVDFDPTADFPSDDIGHGFDNIGDVLTISPVHMERYLAAAESIAQRAITPDPPAPPKRHLSTRYSEPASADVGKKAMEKNWRRMETNGAEVINTGPLNTPYEWKESGEYIFRTRAYAKSGENVRLAVMVYGKDLAQSSSEQALNQVAGRVMEPAKILQVFDLTATSQDKAQTFEVKVPAMAGRHRMMVGLMKPADGKPPAVACVEYLALEGPLDTRPDSQLRLLAHTPGASDAQRTREVLRRFMSRAYRRPATTIEIERLAELVDQMVAAGQKWEAGMQFAVQATLCSPKFLFRVELDDRPQSEGPEPLDEYQLASRLSYFLWSSMPDSELMDLAGKGELSENLDSQVDRMLADPKAESLVTNFALQWLQLKRLEWIAPDGTQFPTFNDRLRSAMLRETELLFDSVMREDRSVVDLIAADYTFLNEPLAKHYGIADTNGNWSGQKAERPGGKPIRGGEFQRVSLQGNTRGGLLTQASILTVTSNPTRTSPVKRGRWVLEQLLGAPPPPPPPNVPELPEQGQAAQGASLRERLEVHRQNPSCANCHAKMDPLGFALENYNAVGAFRTKDGKFEIDPAGKLTDGTPIDGPEDLKQIIAGRKDQFARCLAEKMLIFALGRGTEYYDRRALDKIVRELAANDYRFSVLVKEIVSSAPFRQRTALED